MLVVDNGAVTERALLENLLTLSRGAVKLFLHAYFDESGKEDDGNSINAFVGGCVMTKEDWLSLGSKWSEILHDFGINLYHATDCNSGHGEFRGWEPQKRDRFHATLADEIVKYERVPVWHGVQIKCFKSIQAQYPKIPVSTYEYLVLQCVIYCKGQADQMSGTPTLDVFFEKGPAIRPHIRGMLFKYTEAIVFGTKEEYIPFQIADMFAFEGRKCQEVPIDLDKRPALRMLLNRLTTGCPVAAFFSEAKHIETFFRSINA